MSVTDARSILTKDHVETPVQLVFNPPVLANVTSKSTSIRIERAEEEAHLRRILIPESALGANGHKTAKTRPATVLLVRKYQTRGNLPQTTRLDAMMAALGGLMVSVARLIPNPT